MAIGEFKQGAPVQRGWEPGPKLDALAHSVIGVAIEVHRVLGPGLLESIYEGALCVELAATGIPFARQVQLPVHYKGRDLGTVRPDLVVDRQLIVELKAIESIAAVHVAQVLSYLRFAGLSLGLLVNFNVSELRQGIKRIVRPPTVRP